jgi:CTP synthase
VTRLLYGSDKIVERHRHRYEVNPDLVDEIHHSGLSLVGRDDNRMEIAELSTHPYYVGCQFHPEFLSRPLHPSPPFLGLVLAACGKLDAYLTEKRKSAAA